MASNSQTSGNYIHNLQMTVREQHVQLACIRNCYVNLVQYLCSSKFDNDPTVQVRDVLTRLNEINYQTMGPDSDLVQNLCKPVIATGEITSL